MEQEILTLAGTLAGAGTEEQVLLETLCAAAQQRWAKRLRMGISPTDCTAAFSCAAAFTAAADLTAGRGGSAAPAFTAGELSVREQGASERSNTVMLLRQAAEELMAPYAQPTDFSFKGVRG